MRHWNLRWKLNGILLTVATFSLVSSSILVYYLATTASYDMALQDSYNKLEATRSIKAQNIDRYFSNIRQQMDLLANDLMVIHAIKSFSLTSQEINTVNSNEQSRLADYYHQDFFSKQHQYNPDANPSQIDPLLHQLDSTAIALQSRYIADNPYPLGKKDRMDGREASPSNPLNSYDYVHKQYHHRLHNIQQKLGFHDLFLIDSSQGRVVYSVLKGVDFGTRLNEGAWSQTGLAQAYQKGLQQTQTAYLTDFAPYPPSYNAQAMFISMPIYQEGALLGVLVAQLAIDTIDNIMTNNHEWSQSGNGKTGQSLLIGSDHRLRSDSRFRFQDEKSYLQMLQEENHAFIIAVRAHHNAAGYIKYDNACVRAAFKGDTVTSDQKYNNRGERTLSSYQPLNTPGLNWIIISEMEKAEAMSDITQFKHDVKQDIVLLMMTLLLLILLWTFFISRRITRPLEQVTQQLQALSQGEVTHTNIDYHNHDEIGQLITASVQLNQNLQQIIDQAKTIAQGNFNHYVKILGDNDALGHALLDMTWMLRDLASTSIAITQGDYNTTINLRSEHDKIGEALIAMRNSIQLADASTKAQQWLQSSLIEISSEIPGIQSTESLAQTIISMLSIKLNIPCATFFIRQEQVDLFTNATKPSDNTLLCRGHYACSDEHLNRMVSFGEGLVGQCAVDQKIITIQDIPDDYTHIISSLGDTKPSILTEVPLLANHDVMGVIELASFHPLSAVETELIRQLAPLLGTTIFALQQTQKTESLLEESQAMSEELQAQEEELREGNAMLELQTESLEASKKQLEDQAQELIKKADDLKQASQYKSEFLANMSHELRTPLNSLLILSDMLAKNREGNMSAKQMEYARTIYGSGKDLLNLINSILDLAKVEAGKMTIEPDHFPLTDIRVAMQRDFDHIAEQSGVSFTINLADNLPEAIFSDAMRIKQVLKNLLSNAFKFVEEKGTVSLKISCDGIDQVRFDVCDTGIGISPEKLDHIFGAFQQEDGSTSRKYGGTGLGLSICRELSRLLEGSVSVQSQLGEGSTFSLIIPTHCTTSSAASTPPEIEITDENSEVDPSTLLNVTEIPNPLQDDRDQLVADKRLILIIEDDQKFASLLQSEVREHGFQAINAVRGDHGLALAHHFKPDALLLDLQLPCMNGSTVLDKMKQSVETRHIPIHIISCIDASHRQRLMQHGALSVLQKPAQRKDLDHLLGEMEVFLSRKVKRLLIVEDDEIQNNALRELMLDPTVEIISHTRGDSALDYLRNHRVDCMILDLHLTDMEGEELLSLMEQERESINHGDPVPVILHTASDMDPGAAEKIRKNVRSIIVKGAYSSERLLAETHLFLHHIDNKERDTSIPTKEPKQHNDLSNYTILLVDDDVRNRFSLSSVLDDAEATVYMACNGIEAMAALKEHGTAIDLVLMDIMMPEMDGFEAIEQIRQINAFKQLPIIALTAKAMKEDRDQCIAAGASDFITKPIEPQQLLSLIKVWLND